MHGKGYESLTVTALHFWKSTQTRSIPSFLDARNIGVAHSVWAGLMTFAVSNHPIYFFSTFFAWGPAQYGVKRARRRLKGSNYMRCRAALPRTKWLSHMVLNSSNIRIKIFRYCLYSLSIFTSFPVAFRRVFVIHSNLSVLVYFKFLGL